MRARVLSEPLLEFRAGNRHVDPRFGLLRYGPADADATTRPTQVRVGVVAPADSVGAMREWFERCRNPIPGKQAKPGQENMHPNFPGFGLGTPFGAELCFDSSLTREISDRQMRRFEGQATGRIARDAAELYADHARSLDETGRCSIIVCVRPPEMLDPVDEDVEEGEEPRRAAENFHDLLKAQTLGLGRPLQLLRPETWTGKQPKGRDRPLQDEATRAWNLHTAIYYKAGGSPWRLPRDSTDLSSCFIGLSFFRPLEGDQLHTALAQIFNERGDGVVVRGRTAHVSKIDRQPHLTRDDASITLREALAEFRRVHGHDPARVVIHKTSRFEPREIEGFEAALDAARVEHAEMIWIQRKAGPKLFREGQLPPLRCTMLDLDSNTAMLYTRGSVEFFRTYPGMYVPQPLLLRATRSGSLHTAAVDVLGLSKMNWNNAQLDERDALTLRTADNVGDMLRHLAAGSTVATRYAFYM
jgi:hypothetical protein